MNNPFSPNTTSCADFEVLSDLAWHCTKCELKSAQAKTWQTWRHKGLQLATDEKGNFYKRIFCQDCDKNTIHRKLLSLEISDATKVRSAISPKLVQRIKAIYNYEEAVLLRRLASRELEIDHRFPQIRWDTNEDINDVNMTEDEIKYKFILLSRSNNLLKSRYCERCFKTNKRGHFAGILYWHKGDRNWDRNISPHDERGCEGCFWYDPYIWRKKLNALIERCK